MNRAAYCPRCAGRLEERVPALDTRARKVCTECGFVLYLNPKVAAGCVPVRDGAVGLIRRGVEPGLGSWSWPCGFVEIDETVEEAARRETFEETGLVVELAALRGTYSYPVTAVEGHNASTGLVVLCYTVASVEGTLAAGDDASEARWFPIDEIPWSRLAFDSSRRGLVDCVSGALDPSPRDAG